MSEDCVDQIYSNESALDELVNFTVVLPSIFYDNFEKPSRKQLIDDLINKKILFVEDEFKNYEQIFKDSMMEFIDDIKKKNFSDYRHFVDRTYNFFINIMIFYLYYSLNSIKIHNSSGCEIIRFDYSTDELAYTLNYYINFDEDEMKNLKGLYCDAMYC